MALNVPYRPFAPLKHQHYTLAETQKEKDEEARRKMAIDNNSFANQAALAGMEAQNTANIENAQMAERAQQRGLNQQQQQFQNKLDLRKQSAVEQGLAQQAKNQAYQRQQDAKTNQRLDQQFNLNKRVQDYTLNRQQAEDARIAQERQKREAEKNRIVALGALGGYLERESSPEKEFIDLSGIQDALPQLVNGYSPKGTPKATVGQDGYISLFDDNGPIMNNGNPVRIHSSVLNSAAPIAEQIRLQNIGIEVGKGNTQARKDARDDFEYYRNQAEKTKQAFQKIMFDAPPPPPKGASNQEKAAYNELMKPYKDMEDLIVHYESMASQYANLYEGAPRRGFTLNPYTPSNQERKRESKKAIVDRARAKANSLSGAPKDEEISTARQLGRNIKDLSTATGPNTAVKMGLAGMSAYYKKLREGYPSSLAGQFIQGVTE